jgi:recombination associated protein RdgC
MSLLEAIDQKAFLGTEFLTWLWFRAETGQANFALPDLGEFEIILDNVALLQAEEESDVGSALLKGDAPGASYLMKKAASEGKKIRRATFRVVWENIAWSATVNGETLDVSGVKLPVAAPKSGGGSMHDHWRLRLETLESFLDLWDSLFHYFLAIRLDDPTWNDERDNLVEWLTEELAEGR